MLAAADRAVGADTFGDGRAVNPGIFRQRLAAKRLPLTPRRLRLAGSFLE